MTIVTLQKELGANVADIILVNKHNYHYQRTWLHQAAAGNLHPNRVRFDIKKIINHDKVKFIQDTVVQIKREEKKVILEKNEISYDYLVMALGGQQETLGVKGIKEYTFSISSINAARRISNHIESQFASYQKDDEKKDEKLTVVVGGA